jgi:hypothetical protein
MTIEEIFTETYKEFGLSEKGLERGLREVKLAYPGLFQMDLSNPDDIAEVRAAARAAYDRVFNQWTPEQCREYLKEKAAMATEQAKEN